MSIPTATKARRIHAWLASNPAATSAQVATAMDMPSKNACAILSELEREGFVTGLRRIFGLLRPGLHSLLVPVRAHLVSADRFDSPAQDRASRAVMGWRQGWTRSAQAGWQRHLGRRVVHG